MTCDQASGAAKTSIRLSETQQTEVRRRIAAPEPFIPDHEMQAFFRKLAG
jgi:hypothetical protein